MDLAPTSSEGAGGSGPVLSWLNVTIAILFILLDAFISLILRLDIGTSLIVASGRCVIQLSLMGLVLDQVFASRSIWGVIGIALLLNVLGAFETTYNKAKRRFTNMFPLILASMLAGTIPISILGTSYAMSMRPFWQPDQYSGHAGQSSRRPLLTQTYTIFLIIFAPPCLISHPPIACPFDGMLLAVPILGMILGNAISAIGIAMNFVQREFIENRDKVETYLAFGASRFEACKPVAVEALKLAILPVVNQLSVIGLISIPGMMTGAIVGGKSVEQAAKLQMIIMFMIAASSALSTLSALFFALTTLVDSHHRIRLDRLDARKPAFYAWRDRLAVKLWKSISGLWRNAPAEKPRGTELVGLLQPD